MWLISLLQTTVESVYILEGKITGKRTWAPMVWQENQFRLAEASEENLVFDDIHLRWGDDFNPAAIEAYFNLLVQAIVEEKFDEKAQTVLLLLPTAFPEYWVDMLLKVARSHNLAGKLMLMRASMLAAFIGQLKTDNDADETIHEQFYQQFKANWQQEADLQTLTAIGAEQYNIETIAALFQQISEFKKNVWGFRWPLTIGLMDAGEQWHELVAADEEVPYLRYFFFEMRPKQEESTLVLLAKTSNEQIIEIDRILLAENNQLETVDFSLRLDFSNGWQGNLHIIRNEELIERRQLQLPYLTYRI